LQMLTHHRMAYSPQPAAPRPSTVEMPPMRARGNFHFTSQCGAQITSADRLVSILK
jgi:hypothetical protein